LASDIGIQGRLQGTTLANLVSTGGNITGLGTLITSLLTGSAAGNTALTGPANQVTQLGAFTATNFALVDSAALTVSGPLTATGATGEIQLTNTAPGAAATLDGRVQAPTIVVDAGPNPITLTGNSVITTGGTTRPQTVTNYPGGVVGDPATRDPNTELNGAFLTTSAGFTQQGLTAVNGIGGGPSVMRINALGSASIAFDANAGLQGPSTWLILSIGSGSATGQIKVANLDILRGQAGSTQLTGSVGNNTGPSAAGAAGIAPTPNGNFRFNGCPIASINCVLLPAAAVPTANPLNDIYFGSPFTPNEDDDLLLPIVSDQDY
jgi:hypothetical protein